MRLRYLHLPRCGKLAQTEWTDEEREALRSLIDLTGSGWPRAKLMEILERLDHPDAASDS